MMRLSTLSTLSILTVLMVAHAFGGLSPARAQDDDAPETQPGEPEPAAEVLEGVPSAPDDVETVDETEAWETDAGDPDAEAARSASRWESRPRRPPALDLGFQIRLIRRKLEYNDDLYGLLRGYQLGGGPAVRLSGRWYPAAHFTDNFLANFGVELGWERAFAIDSIAEEPEDTRTFPTRAQEWFIGARVRVPWQAHAFSAGIGYGRQYFIIENSGPAIAGRGNLPEVPQVDYDFLRLHGEARLAVWRGLRATVGGGFRAVFSQGGIESEVWFPNSDANAIELDLTLGYELPYGLEPRIGFDWRRYFHTMNPEVGDPWIAGGALDQYYGLFAALHWRY